MRKMILSGLMFVALKHQPDPHLSSVKQFCPYRKIYNIKEIEL